MRKGAATFCARRTAGASSPRLAFVQYLTTAEYLLCEFAIVAADEWQRNRT
jgi:hypothetical protein